MRAIPDLKITPKLVDGLLKACTWGDLLLAVTLRIRPYEVNEGETNAVHEKWQKRLYSDIINNNRKQLKLKKVIDEIIADFDAIEIDETVKKPKVGVVGEILVKSPP